MTSKKVAIIGAGKAGLVSAKYALEHGFQPVVFEKTNQVGGLWSRNNQTAIWNGLYTNVSKYTMMFHDHPWSKQAPIFNTADQVHEYLKSYSSKFSINEHIRFETKVESFKKLSNNKWEIKSFSNQTVNTETFDYLLVASGLHSKPRVPSIQDSENFQGIQIHSSKFKLNDPNLKDKRVVVLGCSLSGAEISSLLVGHAKTVTNIFPRSYLVTPRLVKFKLSSDQINGDKYKIMPTDVFFNRRSFNYPDKNLNPKDLKNIRIDNFKRLFPYQTNKDICHPDLYVDLNDPSQQMLVSISDHYLDFVRSGKIKPVRSKIKNFKENSILLENGEGIDCDAIVNCTGYDLAYDCMDPSILETIKYDRKDHKYSLILYKCTFHPDVDNFGMIGQTDGTFYTGDELQANWANMVFSGKSRLPTKEVMYEEIKREEARRNKNLRAQYPYGNYTALCDKIAKENGQLPDFEKLKKQNGHLYELLWNSAINSNHFFLNKKISIDVINEIFEMNNRDFEFKKKFDDITFKDVVYEFSKFYKLPQGLYKF